MPTHVKHANQHSKSRVPRESDMADCDEGALNQAFTEEETGAESVNGTNRDVELNSLHAANGDEVFCVDELSGNAVESNEVDLRAEREKEQNDSRNIVFLLFLYFLQGIPLGICGAASFILADKKSSYSDLALFSITSWPYSLKLLWAPFVDSVYWRRLGRRRSWLAPLQYMIGMTMFAMSFSVDGWLSAATITHEHVLLLTVAFLFLYFLTATQDIVVDGWAVSLLSRKRVSWASTANAVGLTAGCSVSALSLLSLSSASFCNSWLRSPEQQKPEGIYSFGDFLFGWSFFFFIGTSLVLLRKERSTDVLSSTEENLGIAETYRTLFQLIKLPAVLRYVFLIFTVRLAFAAVDSVTFVKLIEVGFPKESLAFFRVLLMPVDLLIPLLIARWRNYSQQPLYTWAQMVLPRILSGSAFAVLIYYAPAFRIPHVFVLNHTDLTNYSSSASAYDLSFSFSVILFSIDVLYSSATTVMFLACMAFHARVSNPRIGGTYMTLLNTLSNLSGTLPSFLALWLLDYITLSSCRMPLDSSLTVNVTSDLGAYETVQVQPDFACHTARGKQLCEAAQGTCDVKLDGFNLEVLVSLIYGCAILWWCMRLSRRLDNAPCASWMPAQLRAAESRQNLAETDAEKEA